MTRDQALAIVNNLLVIEAFAKGEIIASRINNRLFHTNVLVLSNFRSDRPIGYEIVKDEFRFEH